MSFSDLGLSDGLLKAVADTGYTTPTPIQQQAIPYVLMGRDILGCAETGTGKTASFALPMIDILSEGRAKARMPRALVLEPTRELAAQVAEAFQVYGKYHRLTMALLIGGESLDEQVKAIERGPDVLIATPGRLMDLYDRGRLLLTDVKILVIDEADRMLDMGFIPDVERIVGLLPRIRNTLLFSATLLPEIRRLADAFLINPKQIAVAPPATAPAMIVQGLVMVRLRERTGHAEVQEQKRATLRRIIDDEDVKNALVFCNRKRDVGVVFRFLTRHGYGAGQLHGDMAQAARTETLDRFRRGDIRLLVCSDVAARGLDIEGMSHVINFDVPVHPENYVHRIGRTGRAGREGRALTIAIPEDRRHIKDIERLIGTTIPVLGPPVHDVHEEQAAESAPAPAREHRRPRRQGRSERPARPQRHPSPPPSPSVAAGGEQPARSHRPPSQRPPSQPHATPRPEPAAVTPLPQRPKHEPRPPEAEVKGLGAHVPAFLRGSPARSGRG